MNSPLSFRGGAISAFTRVFDAQWREPGIRGYREGRRMALDSGPASFARVPE